MKKVLVCKPNQNLSLKKGHAFKYKSVDLTRLHNGDTYVLTDLGNDDGTLTGVLAEESSDEEPVYSLLTDEFGLYGDSVDVKSKIKVSFLDNGLMLVDLYKGAIIIQPEDSLLLATRGIKPPSLDKKGILWVSATRLLSCINCWSGSLGKYTQDYEYMLEVKGGVTALGSTFSVLPLKKETVDISGGAIATLEYNERAKENAKKAESSFNSVLNALSSNLEYEDNDSADDDYAEDIEYDDSDF